MLAGVLLMVVPVAGPLLAWLVARVKGGGLMRPEEDPRALKYAERTTELRRAGEMPAAIERLMSTDAEERLGALVRLSTAADATAVALLRWAIEHGSREVVLDAALTLEELDLRREKRFEAAREAFEEEPTFERAFAAAEAAAHGVLTGLTDDASVPALASQARALYLLALDLDPEKDQERALDVEERLARLELAASRPAVALEILTRVSERHGEKAKSRLAQLIEQAAFAARRFDLLRLPTRATASDGAYYPASPMAA